MKRLILAVRGQKVEGEVQALQNVFENSVCPPPCPVNKDGRNDATTCGSTTWTFSVSRLLQALGPCRRKLFLVEDECLKMSSHSEHCPTHFLDASPFSYILSTGAKRCHTQNTYRQTFISEPVSKLYQSLSVAKYLTEAIKEIFVLICGPGGAWKHGEEGVGT